MGISVADRLFCLYNENEAKAIECYNDLEKKPLSYYVMEVIYKANVF